jgi:hypothetical protein
VIARDPELLMLTDLCRELVKLGLVVSLSDARPAVMIPNAAQPLLVVTVDASREFFEWNDAKERYPVVDLAGAAAMISHRVGTLRTGPGAAP